MAALFEVTVHPLTETDGGLTATRGPQCADAAGDDLPTVMLQAGAAMQAWLDHLDQQAQPTPCAFQCQVVVN